LRGFKRAVALQLVEGSAEGGATDLKPVAQFPFPRELVTPDPEPDVFPQGPGRVRDERAPLGKFGTEGRHLVR